MITRKEAEQQRRGRPENWLLRMRSYLADDILFERIRLRLGYLRYDRVQAWWLRQQQLGRPSFIYRLQPGVRMELFFDNELCRAIYVKNFEIKERAFHNAFLRAGDVYLDIGANMGLFTLIAARRVSPGGRVYAVEPVAHTFQQMQANLLLNRLTNVTAGQVAFSDAPGEAEMYIAAQGLDGFNSMARPSEANYSTEKVRLTTLDAFVAEHGLSGRLTMAKVDVEGWEEHVFAGGRTTLADPSAPVLQVEFSNTARPGANNPAANLYQTLNGLGYRIFDYDLRRRRLVPAEASLADQEYINLFAIKNPDFVQARLGGKAK
jgi:FkbM family methyltransferase